MRRSLSARSSSSTAASAFSIRLSTSPMPRIRWAIRSGWKYSSWSSRSPTETSLIGLPVTALTDRAAPPRASPSSFVRTTPSKATRSAKASATRTASWPVIESSTSNTFVGRVASLTAASSSISSSSTCKRPAVARITVSSPSARAPSRPCSTALTGSERSSLKTGTWIWRPSCSSWSIAAGRCRSAATRPGLRPSLRSSSASLAAAVVLPEPCRPASRITVGGLPANASLESPDPISAVSSSWTIFTTCWPGVRLLATSAPSARSRTRATKSFTTSKLTSASSSASRTSRIAREIDSSSRRPCFRRSPRALCRRSDSVSNTARQSSRAGFSGSAAGGGLAVPRDRVERHRGEQDRPGRDVLDPVGRADKVGAVADHPDDQAAEERPADPAAAAEEADAADHSRRDRVEQERAAAEGQVDRVQAGREDDTAQAGTGAGDREAEDADQLHVDAGTAGGLGVATHGVDVPAEGRSAREVREEHDHEHHDQPDQRHAARVVADGDRAEDQGAVEDDAPDAQEQVPGRQAGSPPAEVGP